MDTSNNPKKRLVVCDPDDPMKWIALDIRNAQKWELEELDNEFDEVGFFPVITTARTLYRLADNRWVLVEQDRHIEGGEANRTYQPLTDAEAAKHLLLSGEDPPDDVLHHVQDKLMPPSPQPTTCHAQAAGDGPQLTDALAGELDVMFLSPEKKFGPVCDNYSADYLTLYQYPGKRWILCTDPTFGAAGKRYESLTQAAVADWFLRYGLELPDDLYQYLPPPGQAIGDDGTVPISNGPASEPVSNDHNVVPAGAREEPPQPKSEVPASPIAKEALAIGYLSQHPDWTDTKIAAAVGVNRTTLYDWKTYKAARAALRNARQDTSKGYRTKEGKLEAFD